MAETPSSFPCETAWSTILAARDPSSSEGSARLNRLVLLYWKPVYWHLLGRWNLSPEDAADLTQEFFLRFFEGDLLKAASPERGRFRTFVKLELRDLVIDDLRRRKALKRGGEGRFVHITPDNAGKLSSPGLDPAEAFDRDWALSLMSDAIGAVEKDLKEQGREAAFQAFHHCVLAAPRKSYEECAKALGLKDSDVRNFVFAVRQELRERVRDALRESLEKPSDLDEEFAYLMELFHR